MDRNVDRHKMIDRILPSRQNIRRLICMYSEGSVWCFKCIVHSCKREWCRHNERERHMKAWKRVKLPLSDVIFRSWAPQTEREVKSELASVLRRLSYSPCVLLALSPPPPPLPPPLSPPSFVISSLCFAPMALLSFLLLFALTAPFIHCLLSCLQLQHSHCSYTAGMFTFSQHQSLLFSPF